ncbi:DNA polymerase III subunit delta [Clostridium gasigenes]|uniref:DNA polymerase III subunit delta n=1 Tax=Clostridium gasigenes TaxID=94869 RepID=A0A1H0TV97_9CLOT|nr:DNA polymerase III subunit delta [Clostridium gasigenes]MBB6624280.1 DNA polymerase III subunit delta [Clostridium gasigenes]MBB6714668.1 DNA polymerase III subunit delta [Clostridium gasigenes]MBU3089265.1 DNA polymerase III subunit delta [Clostridium gasigenes]MBU3105260.1 DNA polymerase III subunit delta [Clostridium gasigenes]MBU3109393.1 DNA polymerase III subunit delta [Clostridium gasigenes]
MINIENLENEIKKGVIDNSYIFCGLDEQLIKEGIELIKSKVVEPGFEDLNYIKLDGSTTTFDEIMNACETIPFMGEKKVVLVYRANFLKDKTDSTDKKTYGEMSTYLKDMPSYTVLIMYYLFNDKRETPKKNRKLITLGKNCKIVHSEKLKKDKYYKKVEEVFKNQGKEIGKNELRYFSEKVQNNFDIIKREVDKLINYTYGREIQKNDIDKLIPNKSEDDIFDLVDFIAQKKIENAIDLMDELLFKADQHMLIIVSIENHFKRLYEVKVLMLNGKKLDQIVSYLKLHPYVCEKTMAQCNRFSIKQLQQLMKICLETERKIKSSSIDKQTEMELMLFKTFMVNK